MVEPTGLVNPVGFSKKWRVALACTNMGAGTLSVIGSSLLIYHTVTTLRQPNRPGVNSTFLRLLLAMSAMDCISSLFSGTFSTVLADRASAAWGSFGNERSCAMSGFFQQVQVGVCFYNASLATFYWINIRFGISNGKIVLKYLEGLLHIVPLVFALVPAILGAAKQYFHPLIVPELGCWIEPYPLGCLLVSDLECTSGPSSLEEQRRWVLALSFWPLIATLSIVFMANVLIFWHVIQSNEATRDQIWVLAVQNLLYVAVMIHTVLWALILYAVYYLDTLPESAYFPLSLMYAMTLPAQGFWNFLVYLRQPYLQLRTVETMTRFRALYYAARYPVRHSHGLRQQSSDSLSDDALATTELATTEAGSSYESERQRDTMAAQAQPVE